MTVRVHSATCDCRTCAKLWREKVKLLWGLLRRIELRRRWCKT